MSEDTDLAVVKAFYRVIENLEVINQLNSLPWVEKTLAEAREQLKKFRGY